MLAGRTRGSGLFRLVAVAAGSTSADRPAWPESDCCALVPPAAAAAGGVTPASGTGRQVSKRRHTSPGRSGQIGGWWRLQTTKPGNSPKAPPGPHPGPCSLCLDRPRPSGAATHVGAAAAGLSRHWVFPDFRSVTQAEIHYRAQTQDSGGLLHPNIEAGQLGAAAVQRHRQMQGVTGA